MSNRIVVHGLPWPDPVTARSRPSASGELIMANQSRSSPPASSRPEWPIVLTEKPRTGENHVPFLETPPCGTKRYGDAPARRRRPHDRTVPAHDAFRGASCSWLVWPLLRGAFLGWVTTAALRLLPDRVPVPRRSNHPSFSRNLDVPSGDQKPVAVTTRGRASHMREASGFTRHEHCPLGASLRPGTFVFADLQSWTAPRENSKLRVHSASNTTHTD